MNLNTELKLWQGRHRTGGVGGLRGILKLQYILMKGKKEATMHVTLFFALK